MASAGPVRLKTGREKMERMKVVAAMLAIAATTLCAGKCSDDEDGADSSECEPAYFGSSVGWEACGNSSGEVNYCGPDSCMSAGCFSNQSECDIQSEDGPYGDSCSECLWAMCDCFIAADCEFVEFYSGDRFFQCIGSSGDADADSDSDVDGDADGDSDSDIDGDSDGDADTDPETCGGDDCFLSNVGDGICDEECDNADCDYDGGDCAEEEPVCDVGTTTCTPTGTMFQACLSEYACCPVPEGFGGESGSVDSSGMGCLYTYVNYGLENENGQYCHFTIDCNNEEGCECSTDWLI